MSSCVVTLFFDFAMNLFWLRCHFAYTETHSAFILHCRNHCPIDVVSYREDFVRTPNGRTNRRTVAAIIFLRATAGTAIARLSHRNSVCLSVRLSVCHTGGSGKTVQARIIKSSPSAAPRTLVSGSVTLFQKFHRGHPNRGP